MKSNDIHVDVKADTSVGIMVQSYVFPNQKKYPMATKGQAAKSLAQAQNTPDIGPVSKAVCRRYPDIPGCNNVTYESAS